MAALPKIMMDANGGGFIDFYQRFQQLQLQRDSTDELIRVRPCPFSPTHSPPLSPSVSQGRGGKTLDIDYSAELVYRGYYAQVLTALAPPLRTFSSTPNRLNPAYATRMRSCGNKLGMPTSTWPMLQNLGETCSSACRIWSTRLVLCLRKMNT